VRLEVTYFDRFPHNGSDTDLYNNLLAWRGQMSSENPRDKSWGPNKAWQPALQNCLEVAGNAAISVGAYGD
jgi:hypothetical protein